MFQVVGVGVAAIWTVPEVAVLLFCFSFSFLAHVLQSSRLARPMRCDFPLKMRANSPKFFRVISISTLLQKLGFRRSREVVPSGANRVCGNEEAFFHVQILGESGQIEAGPRGAVRLELPGLHVHGVVQV